MVQNGNINPNKAGLLGGSNSWFHLLFTPCGFRVKKEYETKSFVIPIKESIISKLFKRPNHKGNTCKKKFRTEIITPFSVSS